MTAHKYISIADGSSVGEVRRAAASLSVLAGLTETDTGRVSVVAIEMVTNLVRHANVGRAAVMIAAEFAGGAGAVEITAIDSGPGMNNVARCFEDGYSTGGTAGNGLGAMRRMSDALDLFTGPAGTVIWCRVGAGGSSSRIPFRPAKPFCVAAFSMPAPGEIECGDAWQVIRTDDGCISILVADGLGHGPLAAEASQAARKTFEACSTLRPGMVIETLHPALAGTRGAAVAVARVDPVAGTLAYAGVGNIAGTLLSPDGSSRGLFSHNGTVGHAVRKIQEFEYPWMPTSLLVLHSDGIQTRWSLDKYAGLILRHPAVIAGVLIRDFLRGRDDATVVVVNRFQESSTVI